MSEPLVRLKIKKQMIARASVALVAISTQADARKQARELQESLYEARCLKDVDAARRRGGSKRMIWPGGIDSPRWEEANYLSCWLKACNNSIVQQYHILVS